jgi:hypothetical protein
VYEYTCTPPGPDVHPPDDDPEHFAPIAERVLDDLAARRAEALERLRRSHRSPTNRLTR